MAHIPAHILNPVAKCGDRVQGDAGAASPFVVALDIGCLHPGSYSGEACSASSRRVAGLFFQCEWRTGNCRYLATQKKGTKRARNAPFLCPRWFRQNSPNSFGKNGGDDETRTRDLCRDRAGPIGFTTTYNNAGTAKIPASRTRLQNLWVGLWVGNFRIATKRAETLPAQGFGFRR